MRCVAFAKTYESMFAVAVAVAIAVALDNGFGPGCACLSWAPRHVHTTCARRPEQACMNKNTTGPMQVQLCRGPRDRGDLVVGRRCQGYTEVTGLDPDEEKKNPERPIFVS